MAVAVASVVPFPCSDSPAEYRAPLVFPSFPAPPARVRKDSGVMVAPAAFSVYRTTQNLATKENNAMAKTGGDESTKDDVLMKDAESDVALPIVSKKRAMRDDEDADELDGSEERDAKKRRVASGMTLVDLKINIIVPPTEPKLAPVVEFEPTVVDDADTAEIDRQIEQIEKQIAEAMQKLESTAPRTPPPSPRSVIASGIDALSLVTAESKPIRQGPLKAFSVTKPGMQISRHSKPAAAGTPAPRVGASGPAAIVPPSLPMAVVDRPAGSKESKPAYAAPTPPSTPTSSLRRSRRLSSLPPIDTKSRRVSPPPKDSLYRQALINRMRIASMTDDFYSPNSSPPSTCATLSSVEDDVDMERVDTDSTASTPEPEPVDPRLFPRQGCLKQMKAEHERRRMEKDFESDVAWFAAKLQWEMEIEAKKNGSRRRRGC
ncbi:hypothetical protein CALCODRAFT_495407 [Calocera cornea HHB12733]|uniref:Uncharacterized protein n=1 Tax=Calocera cornea HHB12733 TaxID=1353952 RepID=A0A165GIW9_9BASI|nr:hypothetical protein CALCODRAFT_495407 [Calocera cornea HHB12733]